MHGCIVPGWPHVICKPDRLSCFSINFHMRLPVPGKPFSFSTNLTNPNHLLKFNVNVVSLLAASFPWAERLCFSEGSPHRPHIMSFMEAEATFISEFQECSTECYKEVDTNQWDKQTPMPIGRKLHLSKCLETNGRVKKKWEGAYFLAKQNKQNLLCCLNQFFPQLIICILQSQLPIN